MQRSLFRSLIRVKLPNREIGLLFKHNVYKDANGKARPVFDILTCKKPLNGITYCEIYKILGDGDVSIMVCGRAYCKSPDVYCKRLGRKRALTSAMNKRHAISKERLFTQVERTLIWQAYWERVNPTPAPLHPYGPIPPEVGTLVDTQGNMMGGE